MDLLRTTVEHRNGWGVVVVEGQLDVATAPQLRQTLIEVAFSEDHRLVVDLDRIEYLDSMGLGVLVGALKRARTHDGDFVIVCANTRIRRLLSLTRLDEIIEVADDLDAVVVPPRDAETAAGDHQTPQV